MIEIRWQECKLTIDSLIYSQIFQAVHCQVTIGIGFPKESVFNYNCTEEMGRISAPNSRRHSEMIPVPAAPWVACANTPLMVTLVIYVE